MGIFDRKEVKHLTGEIQELRQQISGLEKKGYYGDNELNKYIKLLTQNVRFSLVDFTSVDRQSLVDYYKNNAIVRGIIDTTIARAVGELADKHWQEKTRWIPIEERLPKVRENEYPVYAKNERKKNDYAILVIEDSISIHYLKKAFTHWKEIEL